MDEKTEIRSLLERWHRINETRAEVCSHKFTPTCASNASEAMRSSTSASSKLLSSPWPRGMGNQSSGGGFSNPFKIPFPIRVSKPTTKASEAIPSAISASEILFPIGVSKPTTKAPEARFYVWVVSDDELFETIYNPSEAMLSNTSASSKLPWSLGIGNLSESFDPIRNLGGGADGDEGIGKGIGGGWGSGSFSSIEGIGLRARRLCVPVEFGFSHVGDRVEHGGESSSGGGGSGVENAGEQSRGVGNGNEGIGGGRQGGGIEGGVRAGGHGGGNRDDDDDDGNNGGGRRVGDIENGWIPRILREKNLVVIFLPLTVEVVTVCFGLDDANLSDFDSGLRCSALVCCQWSFVLFMASLLERDIRTARILSVIGTILTALGLISIIAVKLPPNLRFINGLAILHVLAIFLKAYLA